MTRFLLLLGAAGLLLAAGCRKNDSYDPSQPLADFARRNSVASQAFTLPLGQDQTIKTAAGATLTFPANGFLLPTGQVATGTAQVRVREIYSVPDMVLADMPTNMAWRGNMLISGGEFNIQVWQGATRLRLGSGLAVVTQSPIPAAQDTTRQYVWEKPTNFVALDSTGWLQNNFERVRSLPGLYRTLLPLDSIGWWNIDQFWGAYATSARTPVTVKTTATAPGETHVYLRPVGFNGLARLWPATAANLITDWQTVMPGGTEMIAVVLQSINGQLYYGTQHVTIRSGLVVSPVMAAVSETEAVRLIRQL